MKYYFILEDHKEQALALSKIIKTYKLEAEITISHSISDAIQKFQAHTYDVFFLDVQLSTIDDISGNGISFGKLIRANEKYRTTPIIFVTSFSDYMSEAINSIHCYGFLTKPYTKEDVCQMLDSMSPNDSSDRLKLKNNDCIYREIPFSEIVFIQSHLHYLHYHTKKDVHRSRQYTMKQLEEILPDYFIRCHKSYFVNRHFISSYDPVNQCLCLNNQTLSIPVGRNYRNDVI